MVGILVVSHGEFSNGLLDSMKMIVGTMDNISHLSLLPGMTIDILSDAVKEKVAILNQGEGVLGTTKRCEIMQSRNGNIIKGR